MEPRVRLMPITLCCASLMLAFKAGETVRDGREIVRMLVGDAQAAKPAAAEEAPAVEKATEEKDAKKEEGASEDAKKEEPAKEGEEKSAESSDKEKEGESTKKEDGKDAADKKDAKKEPKRDFSAAEVDLLQSLSKRREELDARGKDLDMQSQLLSATEVKIDKKIGELKDLEKRVSDLLVQYNEKEDVKIRSLVKIYENMKPKDAARIFDEIDMPILLQVVDRMSERKVAPILAGMNPMRAKEITQQLAEYRRLPENNPAMPETSAVAPGTGVPALPGAAAPLPVATPLPSPSLSPLPPSAGAAPQPGPLPPVTSDPAPANEATLPNPASAPAQ